MKTTFTRAQRFHHRVAARKHYVDPILFQEGWYRSCQEAAEFTTLAVRQWRARLLAGQPIPLPVDAAGNLSLGLKGLPVSFPPE